MDAVTARVARAALIPLLLLATGLVRPDPLPAQTLDHLAFRTIGPANMSGRIVDLAVVESDPYVFYVASATGGVWKTVNNGVTFEPVFRDEGTHSVGDIAVHQRDTSVVWVGTGERANRQSSSWGDGVYKSTDGGRTWTNMGLRESHHVGRIRLHPADPATVFVAAMGHLWGPNEERGLYKSTDGGERWRRVLGVDSSTGVVDVAIDPEDPSVMYAASYQRRRRAWGFDGGGPGSALWRSSDGGETWRKLGPARTEHPPAVAGYDGDGAPPTVHGENGLPLGEWGRVGISIYRSDPRIVYASIEQGWRFNASTAYVERRAGLYRSEDRGETWQHMSDWNPRPMYASQPLVDPNDDQRVYMMNSFSYSDDAGKTFERARQSLHGDDRLVWVNPADSRHVMKADDGGLGISYDRAQTWLYVTSLPVSQFYRVAVDDRHPYNVYGGLQDNGTWFGPNETYRAEGVLNEDWTRIGGGDGFLALPDTTDPRITYAESQYLGLTRVDMETGERRDIRPGDPTGHIAPRRNFDAWYGLRDDPEFLNAMAPANWDGPYLISPHDPAVLYAGTNVLWRSADRGASWTALGDMTAGVDRRDLAIMGRGIDDLTPSLDDGIPYWPTLTAIEESPLEAGTLYVGTDDGRLRVSRDGGRSWTELMDRLPGAPEGAWVAGIEASAHDAGTAYVVLNDYRSDDYGNYLYRTDDFGERWTRIDGGLPPERVLRTVREDPRNPDVLYVGAELGLFYSYDGGARWHELRGNMPTAAFNDLVIHPRENDLVLGTHGRGVWILDQVNALQELDDDVLAADFHLFTLEPAEQIRYWREKAHTGDMIFRGENPPAGAIIDYYLREARDPGDVVIEVLDGDGAVVRRYAEEAEVEVEAETQTESESDGEGAAVPPRHAGLNRFVWDLRHEPLAASDRGGGGPRSGSGDRGPDGPRVVPGTYTVRLTVDGRTRERPVEVREDPRVTASPVERRRWTESLLEIAELHDGAVALLDAYAPLMERLEEQRDTARAGDAADEIEDVAIDDVDEVEEVGELLEEVTSRVARLYFDVSGWTGPPTADQRTQLRAYRARLAELRPRAERLLRAYRVGAVPGPPDRDPGRDAGAAGSVRSSAPAVPGPGDGGIR